MKNPPGTAEVSVSEHAVLRYRERVDAGEPFVREKIRSAFANGEPAELAGFPDPARLEDGVAYVFDPHDREVVTVVKPRESQLSDARSEPDASSGWREEYAHQGVGGVGHE